MRSPGGSGLLYSQKKVEDGGGFVFVVVVVVDIMPQEHFQNHVRKAVTREQNPEVTLVWCVLRRSGVAHTSPGVGDFVT